MHISIITSVALMLTSTLALPMADDKRVKIRAPSNSADVIASRNESPQLPQRGVPSENADSETDVDAVGAWWITDRPDTVTKKARETTECTDPLSAWWVNDAQFNGCGEKAKPKE
ncbi:hypothetical protein BGZ60DRAFT_533202 [Tricladium varicosporioides]|nr:hypothetical protein BGZ60DRAFT_533202 [Hymenoscyphus varicosporioides]